MRGLRTPRGTPQSRGSTGPLTSGCCCCCGSAAACPAPRRPAAASAAAWVAAVQRAWPKQQRRACGARWWRGKQGPAGLRVPSTTTRWGSVQQGVVDLPSVRCVDRRCRRASPQEDVSPQRWPWHRWPRAAAWRLRSCQPRWQHRSAPPRNAGGCAGPVAAADRARFAVGARAGARRARRGGPAVPLPLCGRRQHGAPAGSAAGAARAPGVGAAGGGGHRAWGEAGGGLPTPTACARSRRRNACTGFGRCVAAGQSPGRWYGKRLAAGTLACAPHLPPKTCRPPCACLPACQPLCRRRCWRLRGATPRCSRGLVRSLLPSSTTWRDLVTRSCGRCLTCLRRSRPRQVGGPIVCVRAYVKGVGFRAGLAASASALGGHCCGTVRT